MSFEDSSNPWLQMALNNAWANSTMFATLNQMDREAFVTKRPGFFPSLCRTMNHIYEVDLFYIDALNCGGAGRKVYLREDIEDSRDLASHQAKADMELASICRDMTPERLFSNVIVERRNGETSEMVSSLLLHLGQHQVHHRGQAHVQISSAGLEPPQLDEFYLEFERAPTAEAYW